jgi:V8-like Glu-specific endopeptidase
LLEKARHVSLLMIIIVLTPILSVLAPSQSLVNAAPSSDVVTSGPLPQSDAKVQSYWTPERMKSARPITNQPDGAKRTPNIPPKGPSDSKAPRGPSGSPISVTPANQGAIPNAFPVPPGQYSTFPYSTVGKVFFTDPRTGINFVCSGSAVNSNNTSVVDTAGHCVVQGGSGNNWYSNWIFCPQYNNGSSPFGCWSARQFWSSTDWVNTGSFEDDFGDAVVSPNGHGNIVNVVGGAGWAYGQATAQNFSAYGYPAAPPFNGNTIQACFGTGAASGWDDGTVVAIPCDMTGGSSGGPWFISINNTFGYVNGHNDFVIDNPPTHMYSPYYDIDWFNVFNAAQNS